MKRNKFKTASCCVLVFAILVSLICMTTIVSAAENETVTIQVPGSVDYKMANEVVKLVNEERAKVDLAPLKMTDTLTQSAMLRAAECLTYFSHTRPDDTSCFTVNNDVWGENIAAGQVSAKSVMNSWMTSSGHKDNILDSDYKTIGVGCFYQDGAVYWVQLFGNDDSKAESTRADVEMIIADINVSKTSVEDVQFELNVPSNAKPGDVISDYNCGVLYKGSSYGILRENSEFTIDNEDVITMNENGEFVITGYGEATVRMTIAGYDDLFVDIDVQVEKVLRKKGDVNNDGKIDMRDILDTQKYIAHMKDFSADDIDAADVDHDGKVSMRDLLRIQKYIAHMINEF